MFEEVTEESIEKFKSNYIGSQEERDDIRDYYNRYAMDILLSMDMANFCRRDNYILVPVEVFLHYLSVSCSHGGDLSRFFQYVPFSDPCDIPRYRVILQRLLKDKVSNISSRSS